MELRASNLAIRETTLVPIRRVKEGCFGRVEGFSEMTIGTACSEKTLRTYGM